MSEFEEVLNDDAVNEIINQEGMIAIAQYVEFIQEALEVAVQWLHDVTGETEEDIRIIISQHVKVHDMDEIINKFEAIQDVQEALEDK